MTITATPRLGLNSYGAGSDPFTRAQVDADHAQLDLLCAIDLQGLLAGRPAPGTAGRYYFATDTGQLFREDGTTWWEIPLTTKFRARMYVGSAHAIPNFLWTVLPFDTIQFDHNSNCVTGAAAGYRCPVAGAYDVHYMVAWGAVTVSSGTPTIAARILVNGAEASSGPFQTLVTSTNPSVSSSDLIECAANDLIQIQVFQNSGAPLNTTNISPLSRLAVAFHSR